MRTTSMAIVMLLTSVLAVVGLAVPASAVSSQMTPSRHASQVATAATAGAVVTADDDAKPKKKVCRASWLSAYGCVQVLAEGLGWLSKFWGNDRKCVKRIWYVPVNPSTGQPTGPGAWKCTKTVSR